jgi:hypothetical protein
MVVSMDVNGKRKGDKKILRSERPPSPSARVSELLHLTLTKFVDNPSLRDKAQAAAVQLIPTEQLDALGMVVDKSDPSYRDALLIQLAYGTASTASLDLTRRQVGGRGVAQRLGKWLAQNHIKSVSDCFQNIGKNTENLVRGNDKSFDAILTWLSSGQLQDTQFRALLDYAVARVAARARPVKPMPSLILSRLTFARVCGLLNRLFEETSKGAYEQYAFAALLQSVVEGWGSGLRIETKNLNASDKSAKSAGDVQVMTGPRVIDAYEVTANDWSSKLRGASQTIKDHDLSRAHIVADVAETFSDVIEKLKAESADISVLPIKTTCYLLVSVLTRQKREDALRRMYELLDRYQTDVAVVNGFVEALMENDALT